MADAFQWLDEVPREELEMQAYSLGVSAPDSYPDEDLKAAIRERRERVIAKTGSD